MSTGHRAEILRALTEATQDNAAHSVIMHQAIATHFGLGPTDLKCLNLARHEKELTAGRLAVLTGLSTSAVTALLDRLERGGFIERHRDTADRRKVLVRSTGRHEAALEDIFGRVAAAFASVTDAYDDDELELITGFVLRLNERVREFIPTLVQGLGSD